MSLSAFGIPGASFHRMALVSKRKMGVCHGSALRTALELREMKRPQAAYGTDSPELFPVLTSYEQIVGCILESLREGYVSVAEFERGIETVKCHMTASVRKASGTIDRTKSYDIPTPTTSTAISTPVQRRERSMSMINKPIPLSLDEEDYLIRTERKWSLDTASTTLPQSCTNERRNRSIACIPSCSPTVGCSPAPNIPLPPPSPITIAISRPRTYSHCQYDPMVPSPSQTPTASPFFSVVNSFVCVTNQNHISYNDITLGDVVGSGSFGVVYRARVNSTGQLIVVKVVPIIARDESSVAHVEALENELQLLQELSHQRIVQYLGHERVPAAISRHLSMGILDDTDKLVVYCEYMPGGSLAGTLKQFGSFDEKAIALHTRQIIEGLVFLHENRVCHRDLKCGNILIDVHGNCKLADFGCSKRLDTSAEGATVIMKSLKGTIPFMSPETLSGEGYGRASDIWALGCLVLEMALGRNPWGQFDNIMQAMYRIALESKGPDIPEFLTIPCRNFVARCLSRDPKSRPTAVDLLGDPFVKHSMT